LLRRDSKLLIPVTERYLDIAARTARRRSPELITYIVAPERTPSDLTSMMLAISKCLHREVRKYHTDGAEARYLTASLRAVNEFRGAWSQSQSHGFIDDRDLPDIKRMLAHVVARALCSPANPDTVSNAKTGLLSVPTRVTAQFVPATLISLAHRSR